VPGDSHVAIERIVTHGPESGDPRRAHRDLGCISAECDAEIALHICESLEKASWWSIDALGAVRASWETAKVGALIKSAKEMERRIGRLASRWRNGSQSYPATVTSVKIAPR